MRIYFCYAYSKIPIAFTLAPIHPLCRCVIMQICSHHAKYHEMPRIKYLFNHLKFAFITDICNPIRFTLLFSTNTVCTVIVVVVVVRTTGKYVAVHSVNIALSQLLLSFPLFFFFQVKTFYFKMTQGYREPGIAKFNNNLCDNKCIQYIFLVPHKKFI